MKKIILSLFFVLSCLMTSAQTCIDTVAFDNMETFDWSGDWFIPALTTGFYTNASVSTNTSAVLYGTGTGTSLIEQDWYSMPPIAGLNPFSTYRFSFRLASYTFTSPTAATRGVDNPDFIEVQMSRNGSAFFAEMRIRGFGNATWDYNTLGVASKTANGVTTTYAPVAGGNRTATGDGFSVIQLTIPPGSTQLAFDIFCRVNSAGEEWWIDNVLLEEIYNCTIFPIELIEFDSKCENGTTLLYWSTMTELDNDYFTLEKSTDGINWSTLKEIDGAGTSNEINNYSVIDNFPSKLGNYYRLTQTDYNGDSETFNVIYSDCYRGFISEGISIYPVPVKSTINIEVDSETYSQENLEYKIYNIFGIVVSSGIIDTSKNKITSIDVNEWTSGTYTVVIGTEIRKIVIQK